jgi:DNA-binding IscR family transcriptional regulator
VERLGKVQIAALEYIRDNPGCSQAKAAEYAGAHGNHAVAATMIKHGIRAVAALRRRKLVHAASGGGGGYALTLTDAGEDELTQRAIRA